MPGDVLDDAIDRAVTHVPPTPGVNAPVAKPTPGIALPGPSLPQVDPKNRLDYGLYPPEVIQDRLEAQQELAARFQIVDDKQQGPRLPNQISEAELKKVAATYSDIRMGRGDLTIDASKSADPDQYRADMMNDIGDIMQTKSGRYLIEHLSNATAMDEDGNEVHHHTTLMPSFDKRGNLTTNGPQESATENLIGKAALNDDGSPGAGSDTVIKANPNTDTLEQGPDGETVGRMRSDVTLFHEMVHSYNDTRGFTETGNVQPNEGAIQVAPGIRIPDPNVVSDASQDSPVSHAEYQAVGLGEHKGDFLTENTYRDERTQVAKSGKGMPGDALMAPRQNYVDSVDDYVTIGGR